MSSLGRFAAIWALVSLTSTVALAEEPFFEIVQNRIPMAVSADGSTVVGQLGSWYWTRDEGVVPLPDIPGGSQYNSAAGVSADGSVVVGCATDAERTHACKWDIGGSAVTLTSYLTMLDNAWTWDCSDNGDIHLGGGRVSATDVPAVFRLHPGISVTLLGELLGGSEGAWTQTDCLSGDGNVAVGWSSTDAGSGVDHYEAFCWTEQTGTVSLGVPEGYGASYANSISRDGQVIVGGAFLINQDEQPRHAYYWTEQTGFVVLGGLSPEAPYSAATSVSGDGSVIVGWAPDDTGEYMGGVAVIWDADNGLRDLKDVLVTEYGMAEDIGDLVLVAASGISADGRTIAGYGYWGTDPYSTTGGWIAHLGPPRVLGDCNCDGAADIFDIDPFVLAILFPEAYETTYPGCYRMLADCNGDGYADLFDIDTFVDVILSK